MKKLIYILFLLLTTFGYSQSGQGYVNYKSYRTHYGNGNSSTYNGVTYAGISDNITELEAVLDINQPGTTLTHEGEVLVNSSYGFIGGKPPHWYSEYYAVHHWGWFQAGETGTYRFLLQSDDASALWINEELVLFRPCCGSSYVYVDLVEGEWYRLDTKWQEYTGGDYMRLYYSPPSSSSNFNIGVNNTHMIFTNIEPVPMHKLDVTYNINSSLDKTKFNSWSYYQLLDITNTSRNLSSDGVINYDSNGNGLDENVYGSGLYTSRTESGNVEWCVIYDYDTTNKRYRVGIDKREFPSWFDFPKLTHLQLFDLWDSSVTYKSDDSAWAEYYIYTDTQLDFANSTFSSYIRDASGFYGIRAEFWFDELPTFTPHDIHLGLDETYFTTTYPDMITIADVVKGFSQLTNQTDTPNGPQGGIFTSDVEFILGDVNNDNSFDFLDTQMLLQHIAGETSPFTNNTITNSMLVFDGGYVNAITTNWSSHKPTSKHFTHNLDENDLEKTKSIDVAFLGDLNLSHSAPLQQVEVSAKAPRVLSLSKEQNDTNTMILDVVKENNILKVTLEIPQNQNNIIGTQFKVYYDESRLEFQDSDYSSTISSFTSNRNGYVNIGSFSADGSTNLNNGITYTLNFKLKSNLESTLGLVGLGFSELVDKDGNQINYIVK